MEHAYGPLGNFLLEVESSTRETHLLPLKGHLWLERQPDYNPLMSLQLSGVHTVSGLANRLKPRARSHPPTPLGKRGSSVKKPQVFLTLEDNKEKMCVPKNKNVSNVCRMPKETELSPQET